MRRHATTLPLGHLSFQPNLCDCISGHGRTSLLSSFTLADSGHEQPQAACPKRGTATASIRSTFVSCGSEGGRPAPQVLLDIGAGLGLFTLSAAARGHRVIAMEASPPSGEALQESLAFNGWGKLVTVHRAPAGAVDGLPVCLEREGRHDPQLASGYSTAEVRPRPPSERDRELESEHEQVRRPCLEATLGGHAYSRILFRTHLPA